MYFGFRIELQWVLPVIFKLRGPSELSSYEKGWNYVLTGTNQQILKGLINISY
jgi:hypothetical protein